MLKFKLLYLLQHISEVIIARQSEQRFISLDHKCRVISICLHVLPEIILSIHSVSNRSRDPPVVMQARRQFRTVTTSGLYVAQHKVC